MIYGVFEMDKVEIKSALYKNSYHIGYTIKEPEFRDAIQKKLQELLSLYKTSKVKIKYLVLHITVHAKSQLKMYKGK